MNRDQIIKIYKEWKIQIPISIKDSDEKIDIKKLSSDELLMLKSIPLWNIRGIGPSLAMKLTSMKININNLDKHLDKLPEVTQIWLKYKPLDKIPHNIIPKIVEKFLPFIKNPIIVGSYRRNKPTSGDIDILYDGSDLDKLLTKLSELHKDKWTIYSKGDMKIAGIFHLNKNKCVEIDLWICDQKNKHAMLLYSTGSKNFNIIMRMVAKRKGFKLNQYGLFKDQVLIETKSEKDIFDKLGMKYKDPQFR